MKDPRIVSQAQILVNHSINFKKGERVLISGDIEAKPLILEIYKELIKKGASEVRVNFSSYEFGEAFFEHASKSQIEGFPKIAFNEIKNVDCYIAIGSDKNTRGLTGVDATKITKRSVITRPITNWRVDKTKWVITRFPTEALSQEAGMSLSDYEDFVFDSINKVNWKKLKTSQEKLRKLIDKTKKVRIVGKGTDITLDIMGRKAENCFGTHNMPDGEVFTSVVENGVEGVISYDFPAVFMGREFHDVVLDFKKGIVIKATASKGEKDLNKILDTDKGARRVGELGFGNNYKISKFSKSILFDEKIGGTIHIALGKGYKKTLSKNNSAIHWDMIKDLRSGGKIYFDDKLVQKNGKWMV